MALGLFHCQVCKVMRRGDAEVCKTLTTTEGIMLMNKEVSFLANRECYSLLLSDECVNKMCYECCIFQNSINQTKFECLT